MAGRFIRPLTLVHVICFAVETAQGLSAADLAFTKQQDDGDRLARKLQSLVDGRVVTQQGSPASFEEVCKGFMAAGYSQDYYRRPELVLQPAGTTYSGNPTLPKPLKLPAALYSSYSLQNRKDKVARIGQQRHCFLLHCGTWQLHSVCTAFPNVT